MTGMMTLALVRDYDIRSIEPMNAWKHLANFRKVEREDLGTCYHHAPKTRVEGSLILSSSTSILFVEFNSQILVCVLPSAICFNLFIHTFNPLKQPD